MGDAAGPRPRCRNDRAAAVLGLSEEWWSGSRVTVSSMAEDRRIALAALAVAAVVPIATLIFSNKHDSNRLRAEQVQADRAELRDVLDDAAATLYVMRTDFDRALTRFEETLGTVRGEIPMQNRMLVVVDRPLQRPLDDLGQREVRVAIRLGRGAPAARSMNDTLVAAETVRERIRDLISVASVSRPPTEMTSAGDIVKRALARFSERTRRFIDAAHGVVRSKTA